MTSSPHHTSTTTPSKSGIFALRRVLTRSVVGVIAGAACCVALTAGAVAPAQATTAASSARTIVGGSAGSERYPFMASIPIAAPLAGLDDGNCGAALIDREWVVTAAHCVDREIGSFAQGTVRIGSGKRSSGGTVREIVQVFQHPGYVQGQPNQNDIALIRLDRPVKSKPITIADHAAAPGSKTRILGFGVTKPHKDPTKWKMSEKLRELGTFVGDPSECDTGYAGDTRLCTVSHRADAMACNGDSGGPQIQRGRNGRWELIGVTSGPGAASPSCEKGPGLYTNVTAYRDWVSQTLADNR
ncbi:S1 family peptidase [Microbacterium sp. PMB16]|uniref:S1 family peptidase n=1 Tax=Microbacterium sp. PMB16 TaxID=3120157 RepID=UPI003F4B0FFB